MNLGSSNDNPYHHVGESGNPEEDARERAKYDAHKARFGNPFCFITEFDFWFLYCRVHHAGVPPRNWTQERKTYVAFKEALKRLRRQLTSDERGAVQRLKELRMGLEKYTEAINKRNGSTISGHPRVDRILKLV